MYFPSRYFDPTRYVGLKIDMLTLIEYISTTDTGYFIYKCQCDCGRESIRTSRYLNSKRYLIKHCGCQTHPELIGKRFSNLTVLDFSNISESNGEHQYLCECDCGKTITLFYTNLVSGHTKSCGCLKDVNSSNMKFNKINPDYKIRLSAILNGMKQRCYNKNNVRYHVYGGRGITITDEWIDKDDGYHNFIRWALVNGYQDNLTIERKDVNGNYEPDNCIWIASDEQSWNKQNSICLNGKTINKLAIHPSLKSKIKHIHSRLHSGWDLEKAAYTPVKPQINRNKLFNGKTLLELSKEHDIPYKTLYYRIYVANWDIDKAITTPLHNNHGRKD